MIGFNALGRLSLGRWDASSEAAEPEVTTSYNVTFSEFSNPGLVDWSIQSYDSYLDTYYVVPEDAMTWMQSPYLYCFLSGEEQETVIDSNGEVVIDSSGAVVVQENSSLLLNTAWDWSNSDDSPKESRDIQVYRFRDGHTVALSKNKIRGRGKVLQLKFRSFSDKAFNLLGWGSWIGKNKI